MILLARSMRPEPRHIARPGTRPFYLEHSGQLVITATMWDVVLRDLYDLVRGGRYDQYIRLLIAEGAALYATAGVALDTGEFPTGVDLNMVIRGRAQGYGGYGGVGGHPLENEGIAGDGGNGGDAMRIRHDTTIDNTDGEIFAGGGGGGGGGIAVDGFSIGAGGGGGGGAGTVVGAGGAGGSKSIDNSGEDGTADGGGLGGDGSVTYSQVGGNGGNGGNPGEAGAAGASGTGGSRNEPGGAGGQPGNAIVQSGGTVTFTGGNNSTQIKGGIV